MTDLILKELMDIKEDVGSMKSELSNLSNKMDLFDEKVLIELNWKTVSIVCAVIGIPILV